MPENFIKFINVYTSVYVFFDSDKILSKVTKCPKFL